MDDYTIWIQFVGYAWLSQNFSGCTFENHNLQKENHKSCVEVKLRFSFLSFSSRDMCQTMSTNARASLYIFRTIMYLLTNPHPSIKVIKVLFLIINFPYVFRLETNIIHLLIITNLFILVGNKLYPFAYYYMMFVSIN